MLRSLTSSLTRTFILPSRTLNPSFSRRTMASSVDFVSIISSPNRKPLLQYCYWYQNKILYAPLAESDPEVQNIIDKETWRQLNGLELIASEVCFVSSRWRNASYFYRRTWPVYLSWKQTAPFSPTSTLRAFPARATMVAMNTSMSLKAFAANVHSRPSTSTRLSGVSMCSLTLAVYASVSCLNVFLLLTIPLPDCEVCPAHYNLRQYLIFHSFAALTALIQPQDRLMGLGLPDGGHLTHGYYVCTCVSPWS